MGQRVLRASGTAHEGLRAGIAAIWAEQHLRPDFPDEVERAAEQAAAHGRLPDLDRTDLELVTIDPVGARDLDQALHLERDGEGFVVHYAIADVMAFLEPGDPVDEEAHRRGETLYGADSKVPLHPRVLSEGAASLLPDQVRPAFLWTIRLDAEGTVTRVGVERARVRSRAQLDYAAVQREVDAAPRGSTLEVLRAVGERRLAQEAARGGVSLPMPAQEVDTTDAHWRLEYREMLPVESWNAQVSLLTGICAASLMLEGQVGILRTLPPPPEEAVRRLRRTAQGLGLDWPAEVDYPAFVRGLDATVPAEAAMVVASTSLLRGAGYAAFDGALPEQPLHAALASPYAHVTAPLRRLVDRYGLEVAAALCAGEPVPAWVTDRIATLPEVMRDSGRRANAYENAVLDLVEATTLAERVGERFTGVVVDVEHDDPLRGEVVVREVAAEAKVSSATPLPLGEEVPLTLVEADPATRRVRFSR